MQGVLTLAILVIAGVFAGLTILIVANKAWREAVTRYRLARRRVLEPRVLTFTHSDEISLVETLGGHVPLRDRNILEAILLDHVQRVRGIERERLGRALEQLGYVDEYLEQLDSQRWWKRAEAAEKLGLAGALRATEHLVRVLEDEVSDVRMRAAKALGALGGRASIRPLVRALNEPNRWSTIRIADILTSMGGQVADELVDMFSELSLAGKVASLDIVSRLRPLRVLPWLEELLDDPEPDVRARACHALGALGDPSSGPALGRRLRDSQWPVRAMAAKALGRIRHRPAIPELCRVLRDREWWPRANAAESLRLMGDEGLAALERMLDDPDRYATHQAVLMLQESGIVDRRVGQLVQDGPEQKAAEGLLRRMVRAGQTGHPDNRVREALGRLLGPAEAASHGARP
jgi:HEAT repeat protein